MIFFCYRKEIVSPELTELLPEVSFLLTYITWSLNFILITYIVSVLQASVKKIYLSSTKHLKKTVSRAQWLTPVVPASGG